MIYVYLKGDRYHIYGAKCDGTKDINAFSKEFETFEELENFVISISNHFSIPVQYYM